MSAEVPINQESPLSRLEHAIEHASHLLPAQGPITVFIHHNTLHAFEDMPFIEAVKKGARVFGCQPFLSEDRYREELSRGRIRFDELQDVIREDVGDRATEKLVGGTTRLQLRRAMLQHRLRTGSTEELLWFVAETNALRKVRKAAAASNRIHAISETRHWVMRDLRGRVSFDGDSKLTERSDSLTSLFRRFGESSIESWSEEVWESFALHALWRVCCDGVMKLPEASVPPVPGLRHRDLLCRVADVDSDAPVNELLIRFCSAFLDQGMAAWTLPQRKQGFLNAFLAVYGQHGGPPEPWLRHLAEELRRLPDDPRQAILDSLETLGVHEDEWDDFLSETLLSLRGWAGMIHQIEVRGDRVVRPIPKGSLIEYLAVRLLLDRLALAHLAGEALGYAGPLNGLRAELRRRLPPPCPPTVEQRAFLVFQLAQVLGWTPEELHTLDKAQWAGLIHEIESFDSFERRKTFHLAYERRFYMQSLDALALHARQPSRTPEHPRFQAIFCLDEREESLRRHVEEVAPEAVTYGTAGFFSVAMYYRGAAEAHYVPLCPVVVVPKHWVAEEVVQSHAEAHERRAWTRRLLGSTVHRLHLGSRTFLVGAMLAAVGVLASVPLVGRTFFPRLTARIRRFWSRFVQAPPLSRLKIERANPTPGSETGGIGFSLEEMTDIGEKVLRDIGLTTGFARLVFVVGHGSSSLNNPHASAYDCGACGGSRGGPNARALAAILNDPRIRQRLRARSIELSPNNIFVGGMHNTCAETLTFFDLDLLPETHRQEFEQAHALLELACDRNAHERTRRFRSASLTLSFDGARQHVEGRAEDLAQARPECGHATNALCIVGRRTRTRGLFLDRRAFLTSYDPTSDDSEATVLTRTLQAVFPVCGGINLEYYFSYVDPTGWGSGTKLPHNITSLVGVMDGAASDLRTGLPWQMVEIHEPVRLLVVIEVKAETMLRVLDKHADLARLARNSWIHLAVLDPESDLVQMYRDGAFYKYEPEGERLPRARSSDAWYRGWRDHLEFCEVG